MTDVFADEEGIGRLTCPACGNHLFEILQAFRDGQPCPRCDLPAAAARQVLEAQRKGADAELLGKYQEAMKRALTAEQELGELRARMREVREVANRPMPGH